MTEPKSGDPVLQELKNITKILTLANAVVLEFEIAKIANSDPRKKIWVLIDGERTLNDLAKETGITHQGVLNFVNAAQAAELVEYIQRQPPRRKIDYVPPAWIDLLNASKEKIPEKKEEQSNTSDKEVGSDTK